MYLLLLSFGWNVLVEQFLQGIIPLRMANPLKLQLHSIYALLNDWDHREMKPSYKVYAHNST